MSAIAYKQTVRNTANCLGDRRYSANSGRPAAASPAPHFALIPGERQGQEFPLIVSALDEPVRPGVATGGYWVESRNIYRLTHLI